MEEFCLFSKDAIVFDNFYLNLFEFILFTAQFCVLNIFLHYIFVDMILVEQDCQ